MNPNNDSNSSYDVADRKIMSLISHELRGSFSNILGISNLILKDDLIKQNDLRELVVSIRTTANKSFDLLDNLLHTAKIKEQNHLNICDNINIEELVRNSIEFYRFQIDQKNLLIVLNLYKGLEIKAVRNVLKYIFRNLLNNAIKFSNVGGRIEISSRVIDEYFELEVLDNGIGMTPSTINHIFQNDKIKSMSGTSGEIGIGMGLKLCHQYIKKFKGDLIIGSREGKGSKIIVKLPI